MSNNAWNHVIRRDAGMSVVALSGELDISARDTLLEVVTAEIEHPVSRAVCVDLTAVTFLDSTVMSVLVSGYLTAQDLRRDFTISGATGIVRRSLDTAGLLKLLMP